MKYNYNVNDVEDFIKKEEKNLFSDLNELISIPSVRTDGEGQYTFGKNCGQVLDKALLIGEKYGFETDNHDYYCGSIILPGENADNEIGIVTHLDVVPAGEGWNYEPYKLTEKDGLYIGRGTEDDKGPATAALYAMKYLKDSGIKLPFSVRLILGCDEEVAMTDLPHFLEVRKPPKFSFTPDSEYPVCIGEKGIAGCSITLGSIGKVIVDINGGTVTNAVPFSAYAIVNTNKEIKSFVENENIKLEQLSDNRLKVTAQGKAAHAAFPEGSVNAIGVLTSWIVENIDFEPESNELSSMKFLSKILSEYDGSPLNIKMSDSESGCLTCIGGIVKTEEGRIVQNINIRYPVTMQMEDVFSRLHETVMKNGFSIHLDYDKPPYYRSPESKEIKALMDSYRSITGRKDEPYTTGGGTYARAFPNCVAFGATFPDTCKKLGEGRGGPHERDEYLSKEELFTSIKLFATAIIKLAEAEIS